MTKVLMVGNSQSVKGGITTVIEQFLSYDWNSHDINFKFIPTYKDNNNLVKILFFIYSYIKILFYIVFKRPDVVHIHMSYKGSFNRAYMIQKIAIRFKIKNIIHLHGSEFKKWYDSCNEKKQKKIKEFIRKSYKFIVLGNEWKERIISIEPSANVVVVNNTVSIPEESTFYSTDKLRFLFLGVLIKRKGVHDLLEAINGIPREKLNNVEFIIAGTGDEELNLLNKSKKYNLEKYVNFIGWTDKEKKWQLLQECQCMILPSYNEGLPMAILEAMSYGMPIIATKVGDIPEAVIDSFNGYLFNAGDIDSLKQIIIDFISLNKNEWNKLSSNSKELATEKFSSKEYIETFLVLYSKNNERR